ncbi:MAG TPA: AarF/UbiB family protein [Bryobacteraceae bacterium]|jgi:ubiquinone biosynthesis protein|nr:AarF/UbiB family protein [Bryobacteraceae bacterium]
MTSRQALFDFLHRFFQVLRVVLHLLTVVARRRMAGQPVQGHLLLREGFERVGGSFLKLGQIMSLQVDILPKEYCDALLSLLDRVPTSSREEISGVFLAEFGRPPEELYAEFDYDAIGSASIGQVHRARLHDGVSVAVKVRRPGVLQTFHRDTLLLQSFVWLIFLFRVRSFYFVRDLVREQVTWTRDELDYRREASHCDLVGRNAVGSATERIPKVFWELTTSRVLTTEFLEGFSVSAYLRLVESNDQAALANLKSIGFDPGVFCANVITNFLRDAFRFGVFHADLHPANLLILPGNVVGYVDFGIVAKLTQEARHKQIELTLAYSAGDPEAIYRQFLNICTLTPDTDLEGMRRRIAQMARTWYVEPSVHGKARFRVSVTITMMDLLTAARNYGALVDGEMVKYIRSTVLVDGVVSRLAPGLDLAHALRNVVEEYLFEQSRKKILASGGLITMLTDVAVWMKTGPSSMVRAVELFERRQINLKTFARPDPDPDRPLRLRILAGAAVWALTVVYLSLGGAAGTMRDSAFWAVIVKIFVTSWTIWLLLLLRRLTLAK